MAARNPGSATVSASTMAITSKWSPIRSWSQLSDGPLPGRLREGADVHRRSGVSCILGGAVRAVVGHDMDGVAVPGVPLCDECGDGVSDDGLLVVRWHADCEPVLADTRSVDSRRRDRAAIAAIVRMPRYPDHRVEAPAAAIAADVIADRVGSTASSSIPPGVLLEGQPVHRPASPTAWHMEPVGSRRTQ